MNTYNFNDEAFKTTDIYKKFIMLNPGVGYLKIRASSASGAIPITNLKVTVSKIIDNNNIIFFEGNTNESGIIERIVLPTPTISTDLETAPQGITYDIKVTYQNDNQTYKVNIYEKIYTIQTINIVPNLNVMAGSDYVS